MQEDKEFVVFYNGDDTSPFVLEVGVDEISVKNIQYEATIRALHANTKWGSRANSALFDFKINAILYMEPEKLSKSEAEKNWRNKLLMDVA